MISKDDKKNSNSFELEDELFADPWATIEDLNNEAKIRANSDDIISASINSLLEEHEAYKKVNTAILDNKQDKSDDNLTTDEKTIVGAINEINADKSNFTELQNQVTTNTYDISGIKEDYVKSSSLDNFVDKKQDKSDDNLTTDEKTVIGSINEIKQTTEEHASSLNKHETSINQNANDISEIKEDYVKSSSLDNFVDKKQDKSDDNLTTDDKTVVGAINEINVDYESINLDLIKEGTRIDSLGEQLTEDEEKIKGNTNRIDAIEEWFFERIKELELENEHLRLDLKKANELIPEKDSQINGLTEQVTSLETENGKLRLNLEETNQLIEEKNEKISKLREELENNGAKNDINLKFAYVPEFEINKITTVRNFINDYLIDLIVPRMEIRYPETELKTDYNITLEGLDNIDIMQGRDVVVVVSATERSKLIGRSDFVIKVIHNYDALQQEQFVEQFLQPAIPVSLRGVPEAARPNYNIPNEIAVTKPLKILLDNKKLNQYPFKIYCEMNAACYGIDFHRPWQFIRNGYIGMGGSNIGGNKLINNVRDLYNNDSGYHNRIYKVIEQRLKDSGVSCVLTKKWANINIANESLNAFGNLTFNYDENILGVQKRNYYIMLNFELEINGVKKFYRGVTLLLSDNLDLY